MAAMHTLTTAGPLTLLLYVLTAPPSALHALLTRTDPRSALGWMAMCLFVPYGGPLLYWLLGVNRVRHRRTPPLPARPATARPVAAVAGTLAGLTRDEVVIRRIDERAGTLHVHFPRIGFQIRKTTTT